LACAINDRLFVVRMIVTKAKPAGQQWQCPSGLEISVLHQFRIGYKMHFYLTVPK
jgi:hypothetical protein